MGLLSSDRLLEALSGNGLSTSVGDAAEPVVVTFDPGTKLDAAFRRMQSSRIPAAPVRQNGAMVGLLTMDNILAFIRIREVMNGSGGDAHNRRRPLYPALDSR